MRNLDAIKWLTADETRRLFSVIKGRRDLALFRVAYHHGLRPSEVAKIQVEDVHFEIRKISVHRLKKGLPGTYMMMEPEIKAVRAWIREGKLRTGPLFPGRSGGLSRRMLDLLMKRYGDAAGLPEDKRHFHCLRHSIATHMLEAGEGIEMVKDWLGHRNINNTLVYAQITNTRRDAAAKAREGRLPV
jgi:integrase